MIAIIYTTPTCPYCVQAKDFMRERGIEYVEHDVMVDIERRKEMVEISGQMGVPVIVVGDQVIIGFKAQELGNALDSMGE